MELVERTKYIIKLLIVLLAVLGFYLLSLYYHIYLIQGKLSNNSSLLEIFYIYGLDIFYNSLVDLAIVLIPTILETSNLRRNYREKLHDLYSLKEKLIYLRHEIREIILRPKKQKLISLTMNPVIMNEIKQLLRKFEFIQYANALNGVVSRRMLYYIDDIIIAIIKLTRNYDNDKEYERIKGECYGVPQEIKELIEEDIEDEYLGEKFIERLDWVLAYELFFEMEDKKPVLFYYHIDDFKSIKGIVKVLEDYESIKENQSKEKESVRRLYNFCMLTKNLPLSNFSTKEDIFYFYKLKRDSFYFKIRFNWLNEIEVYRFEIAKKDDGNRYRSIRWFEDGSTPEDNRHSIQILEEFIEHLKSNFNKFLY